MLSSARAAEKFAWIEQIEAKFAAAQPPAVVPQAERMNIEKTAQGGSELEDEAAATDALPPPPEDVKPQADHFWYAPSQLLVCQKPACGGLAAISAVENMWRRQGRSGSVGGGA